MNSPAKLSALQKDILRCLLVHVRWMDGNGGRALWGVSVKGLREKGVSRSDSAAFSRAVRRLEARGLLVRTSCASGLPAEHERHGYIRLKREEPAPRRADHIILTPEGEEAAKRLT